MDQPSATNAPARRRCGVAFSPAHLPAPAARSSASSRSTRDTTPISDAEYGQLLASEPIFVYLDVEITSRLFGDQFASTGDAQGAVFTSVAAAASMTPARVESLHAQGERSVNGGQLPGAEPFAKYFDYGMDQVERELDNIDPSMLPDDLPDGRGEWMAYIANILGVSTSKLQSLYDSAS